jgi:hypothetical protein
MGRFADLMGTLASSFRFGQKPNTATLDWSALTAARTFKFPDKSDTLAVQSVPISQQGGTTYTLTPADVGTLVQRTNATLNKVYVDCTVFDLSKGPAVILLQQVGAGLMSTDVLAGSGGTMTKGGMTASAYQRGSMMYVIVDTNTNFFVGGEVKYL